MNHGDVLIIEPNSPRGLSPLILSGIFHAAFLLLLALIIFFPKSRNRIVDLEVIEFPKAAPAQTNLNLDEPLEKPKPPPPRKAVFGVTRNSITTDSSDAISSKAGNTVAKEQDQLQLDKSDEDALPIPTDDVMVSRMPRLKTEVRIPYPAEAKAQGIEGPVVMDLLIDASGKVRKVDLVRGPGFGLNEAAIDAVKNFEFEPAMMKEQSVAVKIRYTYRFILENR